MSAGITALNSQQLNIPHERWNLFDVDHNPPYNPEIEPDHEKYELTAVLWSFGTCSVLKDFYCRIIQV